MELVLVSLLGITFVLGVFFGLTITLFLVYFPKISEWLRIIRFIYKYKLSEEKKSNDDNKKNP